MITEYARSWIRLQQNGYARRDLSGGRSERALAVLTGPDAHDVVEGRHEYLAIARVLRPHDSADEGHDAIHGGVGHRQLQLDLLAGVDRILDTPVHAHPARGPAEAANLRDRHRDDPGFGQGISHGVELVRLDGHFDLFHDVLLTSAPAPAVPSTRPPLRQLYSATHTQKN